MITFPQPIFTYGDKFPEPVEDAQIDIEGSQDAGSSNTINIIGGNGF